MRPRLFTYTLAAAHADGFFDGLTGTINLTPSTAVVSAPGDGCAHETQLVLATGGSLAAVTITVTGTDAEDRVQTESIAGPSATTTLTKYYKTMTSITSSATLGASTMDVGWTALARTPAYATAYSGGAPNMSVNLNDTTVNYTAQESNDNVFANNPAQWHDVPDAANIAVDHVCEGASGTSAFRIVINSHTSGVLSVTHSQPR